jgi:hypothetical protein
MIKLEVSCYECAYCGRKYNTPEECAKCELQHEDIYTAEKNRFISFRNEMQEITNNKHTRPMIEVTEEVDTGEVDIDNNPIMKTEKKMIPGDLTILHCSKCLRQIQENSLYVTSFGYNLCLECAIPMFRTFSKNYMTFRTQFANQVNGRYGCVQNIIDEDANAILHNQHQHYHNPNNADTDDCKCHH